MSQASEAGATALCGGGEAEVEGETRSRPRPSRSGWAVAVLVAVLALPLVVALVVLREPRWYPIGDLAQTELMTGDVFSTDPPLVGLAGRLGTLEHPGNHPGPAGFFALAPVYRLLGASPFSLQVSTVVVNLAAVATALWLAARRGGPLLALTTATVLALLLRSLGTGVLTEPWNPHLPLLWWFAFLFAVWAVWCGDDLALPVAVVAGSLPAQTHVPYTGTVGVMVAVTAAVVLTRVVRGRDGPAARHRTIIWSVVAVVVGLLAWSPPVVDELTAEPGNLTILGRYLLDGGGDPVGAGTALGVWLGHLDPVTLATRSLGEPGPGNRVVGALFLVGWAGVALLARHRRDDPMLRLHGVAALAALAGLVATSRIFGPVYYYLVLSLWVTTAVALVAVAATLLRALVEAPERWEVPACGRARAVLGTLVGLTLVAVVASGLDARHAEQGAAVYSEALGAVTPATVAALDGPARTGAPGGPVLVEAHDPFAIGSQGYGLFHELRRAGIDARLSPAAANAAAGHVIAPRDASTVVSLVTGPLIEEWRARPEAREIAHYDPRTPSERRRQERLLAEAEDRLRRAGRDGLADRVRTDTAVLVFQDALPADVEQILVEAQQIGAPIAVFISPPPD